MKGLPEGQINRVIELPVGNHPFDLSHRFNGFKLITFCRCSGPRKCNMPLPVWNDIRKAITRPKSDLIFCCCGQSDLPDSHIEFSSVGSRADDSAVTMDALSGKSVLTLASSYVHFIAAIVCIPVHTRSSPQEVRRDGELATQTQRAVPIYTLNKNTVGDAGIHPIGICAPNS
jgi:hypothetical protein